MEQLEYRFRWNAFEHRRFYRALQRESRRGSKVWIAMYAWMWMLGTVGALTMATARNSEGVRVGAETLAFVIVWLVFDRVVAGFLQARSYARHHAPCIPNDQVRLLTAEGLTARCTTTTASVTWDGILRVAETRTSSSS